MLRRLAVNWAGLSARSYHACPAIDLSPDVRAALDNGDPVVALESTIITHGMPRPINYQTARNVQDIVKDQGAVPATIGILRGRIKVGLSDEELEYLADESSQAIKVSRRDLPMVTSKALNGGTTVAATMFIAHMAGIPVFATGGIGGVHRGGELSWDVSADLTELGRTPVAVVCSGVKSILDIPRTLQVLETQGVGVATHGPDADFPAFYCRKSGHKSPCHLPRICDVVSYVRAMLNMKLGSGVIIAVPVPEEHALQESIIEDAIRSAVAEAEHLGVTGPKVTPFILRHIAQKSENGKAALAANIALIKNNAEVSGKIAVGLREASTRKRSDPTPCWKQNSETSKEIDKVTVIGGSVLDLVVRVTSPEMVTDGRTLDGDISLSGGGVGRNIADALSKLGTPVHFISAIGDDYFGQFLEKNTLSHLKSTGLITGESKTSCCLVVCDKQGDSRLLVGDMRAHQKLDRESLSLKKDEILNSSLLVLDGNVPHDGIQYILQLSQQHDIPVLFEPTDLLRAQAVFHYGVKIAFATPNLCEFLAIVQHVLPDTRLENDPCEDHLHETARLLVAHSVDNIVLTLGAKGVLIARRGEKTDPFFNKDRPQPKLALQDCPPSSRLYRPPLFRPEEIVNVSGAGDCFASGFVAAMLNGHSEEYCVTSGFKASQAALKSSSTVPKSF